MKKSFFIIIILKKRDIKKLYNITKRKKYIYKFLNLDINSIISSIFIVSVMNCSALSK